MKTYLIAVIVVIIILVAALGFYVITLTSTSTSTSSTSTSGKVISVVAAENFWGSLVGQLGGVHVNVTSIVSDPNADPHEYEANPVDAEAIAGAQYVIVNGADYDTWALQLISASDTPGQVVLNVQDVINSTASPGCIELNYTAVHGCTNPHLWYSPYYVNATVHAMYSDLVSIDPTDKSYFTQQYASLNSSLWTSYMSRIVEIRQEYASAPIASTESIFAYMANATGLDLISPPGFMQAVAEGNDPSAQDVATFQQQIQGGNTTVHVLVYNEQTVTPLTQNIKAMAAKYEIPTIGVTETIQPPDAQFQAWMGAEVSDLQNALNAQALGN
jgi:zinc/manganese transport system substrate-binding protein